MTIHIESLSFDAIIGLLDSEREKEQRVIVDIEANYAYEEGVFIDYAEMATVVQEEIKTGRYELLEEALLGLKKRLFETYPKLERMKIKISKPDILPNCRVALSKQWNF